MELDIAVHQTRAYTVATPVFSGPLDLLLHLIERAELDITRLSLAMVTDQYLAHLRELPEQVAEEVSAFLVIAARLIQIKSEMLLPRPPIRQPEEEDPGEELARQLQTYKQFKEIADYLAKREAAGLRTYLRLAPPGRVEPSFDLSGMSLKDLVEAAFAVYTSIEDLPSLGVVVPAPRITIREKIALIAGRLRSTERLSFSQLLPEHITQLDIVVTFLAMLELIKRNLITAHQEHLFAEITLEKSDAWEETTDFELEFGE